MLIPVIESKKDKPNVGKNLWGISLNSCTKITLEIAVTCHRFLRPKAITEMGAKLINSLDAAIEVAGI